MSNLMFNQFGSSPPLANFSNLDATQVQPYNPQPSQGYGFSTLGSGGTSSLGGLQMAQLGLGGLQTAAGLFSSFQSNRLAGRALKQQENAYRTNLANETKSYNTALADRARSRFHTEGKSQSAANRYIAENSL